MKISTILAGAAILALGMSAQAAEENLMRGATEGATGNVAGPDAPLVQDGWQLWKCPFKEINGVFTFEADFDWATSGLEKENFVPQNITEDWPANVRLESYPSKCTMPDGSPYAGNVALFRWDGGGDHTRWFCYPVEIATPGYYDFEMLAGNWNNNNDGDTNGDNPCYVKQCGLRVTISKEVGPEYLDYVYWEDVTPEQSAEERGVVKEFCGKVFKIENGGSEAPVMNKCSATLLAPTAGKYYISLQGSHTIFVTSEFSLKFAAPYEGGSGVEETLATDVVKTTYYTIDCVEVSNPANGSLIIEKKTLSDGSIKVSKRIIR